MAVRKKLVSVLEAVAFLVVVCISVIAYADYENCPQVTVKSVDCPGKADVPCGNPNLLRDNPLDWCDNVYREVQLGNFKTKPNAPNETNTQTKGNPQDRVVCLKAYKCAFKLLPLPSTCVKGARNAADDDLANPLEEIACTP